MKELVKFCKENNYDFITENLSNGVSRVVIEDVNLQDVKKIKEKVIKSGLYADVTAYGNERDVAIYTNEGEKEMMKIYNPTTINTIDDMLNALNRAKSVLGGDAPFNVINDFGTLNLTFNNNVVISNGALIINASDWTTLDKDMDF